MTVPFIPLRTQIGKLYYFVEESIYPVGELIYWLMQLKEYNKHNSIIFTVLTTNNENFCDPGLNIADISCTTEWCLFTAQGAKVMEEVKWDDDFSRFLNFPLLDRDYCKGAGRIYYHKKKFAEFCPREILPTLIGINNEMDKVIAERLKDNE